MKKITNLLIVASLALAGAAMAQAPTPDEAQAPGKKAEKKAPGEVKPKAPKPPKTDTPVVAPKADAPAVAPKTDAPAMKEPAANEAPAAPKADKKGPSKKPMPATTPEAKTSAEQPATSMTPASKKDKKAADANASTSPSVAPATTKATSTPAVASTPATAAATSTPATAKTTPAPATTTATTTPATATASTTPAAAATSTPATAAASTTPATAASASVAPATAQTSPAATVNPNAAKKPEPQKIQQIQQRHATFRAQARLDVAPAVTFTPNYRIQGSDRWQGPQYEVYRSYRPERHDQGYYRSKYQRVELIAGGYYYFHNNYWYPAWGYSPREEYYAYDAPIYVGKTAQPPDKVIANVQAVLQEMGYYKGEVDGLLGPLTRQALTGYQTDHGMTVTAVIDEPTLASLDMG